MHWFFNLNILHNITGPHLIIPKVIILLRCTKLVIPYFLPGWNLSLLVDLLLSYRRAMRLVRILINSTQLGGLLGSNTNIWVFGRS